ncbi:MAG TPA: histidine phosphatase family protein [Acidimicrobiales bacterium]|nr:histidine phosphatase family protein [Acidimicrobiales bacterium]
MTGGSVWVLRHAKAASQGPDDHSRPLTARGKRQASDVGRHLAGAPIAGVAVPELVLSSSARRALQTAKLVMAEMTTPVELVVERRLYDADADDVAEVLRELGAGAPSVLVVGHNPTLQEFALLLVDPQDAGRARLEEGFPTAALAVVAVPAPPWGRLSMGTGTLLEVRTPPR